MFSKSVRAIKAAALCGSLFAVCSVAADSTDKHPLEAKVHDSIASEAQYEILGFADAEQFVHGYLYDAMIAVWSVDRKSWNQVLHVHACGDASQSVRLEQSYQALYPLFAEAMQTLAERESVFTEPAETKALADSAQLAYRLFSASYAHGYARQILRADTISPGLREEICGSDVLPEGISQISYANDIVWQTTDHASKELIEVNRHAEGGYQAFMSMLGGQYDKFDALVYSHAYQQTDAYDQLFVEVTRHENVSTYSSVLQPAFASGQDESLPTHHADFAYLLLSSGYHWGTLAVLALLEEEYPRLHEKAKTQAISQIKGVMNSAPATAHQQQPDVSKQSDS